MAKTTKGVHDEDEDEDIDSPQIDVDDEIVEASQDTELEDIFGDDVALTIDDWDDATYFAIKADEMPVPIGGKDTFPFRGKRIYVSRMIPQALQLVPGQMMIAKKQNDNMRMVTLVEKLYATLSKVLLDWDLTDPTDPLHRRLPSPYGNPDAIQALPNESVNWIVGKVVSGDQSNEKKGSSSTPRTRSAQLTRVR